MEIFTNKMDLSESKRKGKTISLPEYAASLVSAGERVFQGSKDTLWINHGLGALTRIPPSYLMPPDDGEIRFLLRGGRTLIVDYIQEPDEHHPANSCLYIITDQLYSLDKLVPAMRRNVHRGLRELRIAPISSDEVLAHGLQAFCDTRLRNGLSDGMPEVFRKRFMSTAQSQGHVFFGAWKDDQLAAFLSIIEVDDWADIEGAYSMNALLKSRPNDSIMFSVLHHYLVERRYQAVTYGVSSIQAESNVEGLHAFKTKVGFEAKPVHRAFILHPLLHPFVNQLTLWGLNAALRLQPGNRVLKKIRGMLSLLINKK